MAANRGKKAIIGGTVTGIFVFAVALVSSGVLGGCATFSRNSGFGAVEQAARERLNKDVKWQRDDVERDSVRSAVRGGMFTVVKIREGLARGDYRDPGWYRHPKGSVAYEWNGALPTS